MIPHAERDPSFDAYAEALRERENLFARIHERLDEEHPPLPPLLLSPLDMPDVIEPEPPASDRLDRMMQGRYWFLTTCILAGSLVGLIVGLLLS